MAAPNAMIEVQKGARQRNDPQIATSLTERKNSDIAPSVMDQAVMRLVLEEIERLANDAIANGG
ncbi:hypothetical protein [Rhizobium tubonense]|uniref:Uncharacterized protein n=1 Tax=Rhizobium tubonense TaxID=484088 RepID=A0A2W4CCJ6_9HYPH|nr:hypothetical protein [Rhizobium tubonense]PZM08958.1 hypothetical protein CPY51_27520 [Rhizobium tubonense]